MFSTVKELYAYIDLELQQANTNRKRSFKPEHYDYAINSVILDHIKSKIDSKYNNQKEGFDDSQIRVDELKELKKKLIFNFYRDNSYRSYIILPCDYYRLISGSSFATIHYNRKQLTNVESNSTKYILLKPFATTNFTAFTNFTGIAFNINGNTFTYNKSLTSLDSRFEIINVVLSEYKKYSNLFNIYWEYYDGLYYKDKFIVVSNSTNTFTITLGSYSGNSSESTEVLNTSSTTGNVITSPIELIPSDEISYILNNSKLSNNRHKKPICELSDDRLYCYFNREFIPLSIEIAYLIKPKLVNYYINSIPEITINSEIISKCVDKLKVAIKDEQAYNMFLNQLNKV